MRSGAFSHGEPMLCPGRLEKFSLCLPKTRCISHLGMWYAKKIWYLQVNHWFFWIRKTVNKFLHFDAGNHSSAGDDQSKEPNKIVTELLPYHNYTCTSKIIFAGERIETHTKEIQTDVGGEYNIYYSCKHNRKESILCFYYRSSQLSTYANCRASQIFNGPFEFLK